MSLTEVLKDKLSDEEYKKVGSALQKEISKIMVPKEDFNKLNDEKKVLIEDKKTLETEKTTIETAKGKVEADLVEANKKIETKETDKLTEMEKLQKSIEDLKTLGVEEKAERTKLESQI